MNDRKLIQQALDALETICGFKRTKVDIPNVISALRARLAQPEQEPTVKEFLQVQEPVAWMNAKRDMSFLFGPYNADDIPLYTTPPQREWKGLTDEELKAAIAEKNITPLFTYRMVGRAIEAKLKVKNA